MWIKRFSTAGVVTAITAGVIAVAPGVAGATTVSPAGPFTASSSLVTFADLTNGQTFKCTGSRLTGTVSSTGVLAVPAGSATFTGCTNSLLGNFTFTQPAAWSGQIDYIGGSWKTTLTLPPASMQIQWNSLCTMKLGGSVVSTSGFQFNSTGLQIGQIVGGCLGIYNPGDSWRMTVSYSLSPSLTVGP